MTKFLLLFFILFAQNAFGQSFSPAAGQPGSTAISKDSSIIVSWATGATIVRGYRDIALPDSGFVSFGIVQNAFGQAEGNSVDIVSLGDGGTIVLTFNSPIFNGPGPDFAVFENGFTDNYLELAFVEVSSDGVNFVRFPAISETPVNNQIGPFEYSDCRYVHNFAGKYRQGYGTPFDLQDLIDSSGIDLNSITHVKLIDVVGSINPLFGSHDSQGNIINDLYPTLFESGGFDLDGVGVIHQNLATMEEHTLNFNMYPNPVKNSIYIDTEESVSIRVLDVSGRLLIESAASYTHQINLSDLASQVLIVIIENTQKFVTRRVLKMD